jgi:hypothetical protein
MLHWDIANPTSASGTQLQMEAAFRQAYDRLLERIAAFVNP